LESSKTWRYERKFVILIFTKQDIEMILRLHPALFTEMYYERKVNSLYFDSFFMESLFNNESGSTDRKKIRIRWYGDLFGVIEKPTLEIKCKNGYVGHKLSFRINEFIMDESLNIETIKKTIKESNIPDLIKIKLLDLGYFLITSYWRKYFQSADKRFRVTIDSEMEYIKVDPFENSFLNRLVDNGRIILELKYDKEYAQYAEKITNWFGFRLNKNSKYMKAWEHLYSVV
jgi:SPX domain protein involved in polyphosphate accumulation